jgi:hypothetical protein
MHGDIIIFPSPYCQLEFWAKKEVTQCLSGEYAACITTIILFSATSLHTDIAE